MLNSLIKELSIFFKKNDVEILFPNGDFYDFNESYIPYWIHFNEKDCSIEDILPLLTHDLLNELKGHKKIKFHTLPLITPFECEILHLNNIILRKTRGKFLDNTKAAKIECVFTLH
jgi:hypothetical protein